MRRYSCLLIILLIGCGDDGSTDMDEPVDGSMTGSDADTMVGDDAGPETDSGMMMDVDSGMMMDVDSGMMMDVDSGMMMDVDSGMMMDVDMGTPPVDMGTPPVDMGTPPVDMGTPPVDMGTPPVDMGTRRTCSPLTDWEQMMLDDHNRWRGMVDPPAADMQRLYWDENIAANAAAWVASCDPDWPHSPGSSRNIGGYADLSENLSYCAGTGCSNHPEVTDGSGKGDADGWWDERHDYDYATNTATGNVSHYRPMVASNVYAIGCATQLCNAPGPFGWSGQWWWTICQYGPRAQGVAGGRPYATGPGGLVEPDASVFAAHPGLCVAP